MFGEGKGAYDDIPELSFGVMYHGITYADEAYDDKTAGRMTARFWRPVMRRGVISFPAPEDCPIQKYLRDMEMKPFGEQNFSALCEFGEVT